MPNNQVHIAVTLLWASVALGVMNLGLHAWLIYQATGKVDASSPLLISAAILIFVQSRLILGLHSGNPTVRTRLLFITLVRMVALAPSVHILFGIMPAFVLLPGAAAVLQLVALGLVFLPPGSAYFAKPALARR
jgi:hypothetical protein